MALSALRWTQAENTEILAFVDRTTTSGTLSYYPLCIRAKTGCIDWSQNPITLRGERSSRAVSQHFYRIVSPFVERREISSLAKERIIQLVGSGIYKPSKIAVKLFEENMQKCVGEKIKHYFLKGSYLSVRTIDNYMRVLVQERNSNSERVRGKRTREGVAISGSSASATGSSLSTVVAPVAPNIEMGVKKITDVLVKYLSNRPKMKKAVQQILLSLTPEQSFMFVTEILCKAAPDRFEELQVALPSFTQALLKGQEQFIIANVLADFFNMP